MTSPTEILSDITIHMKYARFLPQLNRRETWGEIVERNKAMHQAKFPKLAKMIGEIWDDYVLTKKVLPSMRSLQFAGKAIETTPNRMFNCSYLPIDDLSAFSETMFLLLSGCGVGYSVQSHHIEQLPLITHPNANKTQRFVVGDSIEGWADAVKYLMKCYLGVHNHKPEFDFSEVREKGSLLVTSGGKAPGSEPLRNCLIRIENILTQATNHAKLTSLQVHDILCHIADAVLSGGIRRAAMICLFDKGDESMLTCKIGEWWVDNPQRARANNSVVLMRDTTTQAEFNQIFEKVEASGCGEPGIYWNNHKDWGTNPCFSGDTVVAVADGRNGVRIDELANQSNGVLKFPVYSAKPINFSNQKGDSGKFSHWKIEIKNAVAFKTGVKEVVIVKLSDGSSFKCTEEHQLALKSGGYVRAKDSIGCQLQDFFTHFDGRYRHINSKTDGHKRQYRMIWEFYNGAKPALYQIDHVKNGVGDFIGNLQLLTDEQHNNKTSEERIGGDNPVFKIKNKDRWKNKLSTATTLENNGKFNGLSNRELFLVGREVLESGLSLTLSNLLKICPKFPKSFSKNRFNGSFSFFKESVINDSFQQKDVVAKSEEDFLLFDKPLQELTVVGIELIEEQDVYDLTVEDNSNFYILNEYDEDFKNSKGVLVHNCCEIALQPFQFCNLTEINVATIISQQDFYDRCRAASFIGTLQASYTNFHYLRPIWRTQTEKEALLGVSMTGLASNKLRDFNIDLTLAVAKIQAINQVIASQIGINTANRLTCVKPAGTTSLVLGTSSGIHAYHDHHYIRRIRVNKTESIYGYLTSKHPELIEDDQFSPSTTAIISVPQCSNGRGVVRSDETALQLLQRIIDLSKTWVAYGHNQGENTHNISATVNVKPEEWSQVKDFMWLNRKAYNGISLLPYDGGTYVQAPFETIDRYQYSHLVAKLHDIDLTQVIETTDNTNLNDQVACAGGVCEIQ